MRKLLSFILILLSVLLYSAEKIDYFDRAKKHFDKGNLDLAYENFQNASNQSKVDKEVYLYIFRTAYLMKKYNQAYKAFLKAVQFYKLSSLKKYLFRAAQCAAFFGKFNQANKYLDKIKDYGLEIDRLKIKKLDVFIKYRIKERKLIKLTLSNKVEDFLNLARFYIKSGYFYLAAEQYLKAYDLEKRNKAGITNELAKFFLKRKMWYQSKQIFLKSLKANKFDLSATYHLGRMYFKEKNFQQSMYMFNRMKLVSKSYIPYLYLGEIYANTPGARFLSQGKVLHEAIGFLKKAESLGARSERLYLLLSYLYRNSDKKQYKKYARYAKVFRKEKLSSSRLKTFRTVMKIKRLTELLKVFKGDVRQKNILFSLAKAYAFNEQYENAKNTILKVIKKDNSNFRYFYILGYSYFKLNNIERATVALKKTLSLNPRTHKAYYYLARISTFPEYYNYNNYIRNLKRALYYSPNNAKYIKELSFHYLKQNNVNSLYKSYKKLSRLGLPYKKEVKRLSRMIKLAKLEKEYSFGHDFETGLKPIINLRLVLNPADKKIPEYLNELKNRGLYTHKAKYYEALYYYSRFCSIFKKSDLVKSIKLLKSLMLEKPYFEDTYYLMSLVYLYGRVDLNKAKETLYTYKNRSQGYDVPYINNLIKQIELGLINETGNLVDIGYSVFKSNHSYYSLDYLLRAHKKDEKNERLLLVLGEIYKTKKEYEKAIFYYKKAVKHNGWNPGVHLALGNAYFSMFLNTPKNLRDFNTNYDPDKTFPGSNYALSKLKEKLNETRRGAINAYRIYIKQRSPFIVNDLHPQHYNNIVTYLERLKFDENYLNTRLGFFLIRNKKVQEGINIFKKLFEKKNKSKSVFYHILRAYKLINDYKMVEKVYRKFASIFPRNADLHYEMGKYYLKRGNTIYAIQSLNRAYKLEKNKETELWLAHTYYMMGKLPRAEKFYLMSLAKFKPDELLNHADAYFNLAIIKNKKGDLKQSMEYYKQALTAVKQYTFTKDISKYNTMLRHIYLNLSKLNLYIGKFRKAFNWLIEARIFDPGFKHKYEAMVGDILFLNKRFKYATSYYRNALKVLKNDRKIIFRIAACYKEIGQYKRAIKVLSKLYYKYKGNMQIEAILLLGDLYMILKNYNKAHSIFSLALAFNRTDYRVYIKLANCYKSLNKPLRGVYIISKNIYSVKKRAILYNFLAWFMAERDIKLNKAELWAKKAVLMQPDNVTFLKTLAYLYFKTGKFLEYFRVVKRIEKNNNTKNIIATDYFNYFYSYEKAYGYFKNENYVIAIAKLYNKKEILSFQTKFKDYKSARK